MREKIFKLTNYADSDIDKKLEARGYQLVKTVELMVCDLDSLKYNNFEFNGIESSNTIDDEWLNNFIYLKGIKDISFKKIQSSILKNISLEILFPQ